MRRYIIAIAFAIGIILLYRTININLFSIDLTKRTNDALFKVYHRSITDESITILNLGKLQPKELLNRIDTLLTYNPKKIGVNLCHFSATNKEIQNYYVNNPKIVFANCGEGLHSLSRIINEGNIVTHFKSDNNNYFEVELSNGWEKLQSRNNSFERINYRGVIRHYMQADLYDLNSFVPAIIENKIVLIGYVGDYVTEEIYDYTNCRITPLNRYYGDNTTPDMYDTQISANIISTINNAKFINDANLYARVAVILAYSILNVILLTYIRTKWIILNLIIYSIILIILMFSAPALIIYSFHKNFFIELNELPMILIITTLFTVGLNMWPPDSAKSPA